MWAYSCATRRIPSHSPSAKEEALRVVSKLLTLDSSMVDCVFKKFGQSYKELLVLSGTMFECLIAIVQLKVLTFLPKLDRLQSDLEVFVAEGKQLRFSTVSVNVLSGTRIVRAFKLSAGRVPNRGLVDSGTAPPPNVSTCCTTGSRIANELGSSYRVRRALMRHRNKILIKRRIAVSRFRAIPTNRVSICVSKDFICSFCLSPLSQRNACGVVRVSQLLNGLKIPVCRIGIGEESECLWDRRERERELAAVSL